MRGTIRWISTAQRAAEFRLYDRLFTEENPLGIARWNTPGLIPTPDRATRLCGTPPRKLRKTRFQFERVGYFCADADHTAEKTDLQPYRWFTRRETPRATARRAPKQPARNISDLCNQRERNSSTARALCVSDAHRYTA